MFPLKLCSHICVLYNIKISISNQFWIWISIRSTPCNWTVDDPIFALLVLFCTKKSLIFSTYFLQHIVLILCKLFSPAEIILLMINMFFEEFWSQIYVFFVLTSMLYPLCVHRIIKVDSILYQKFVLWTYSPFRHEVSLLYFSRNNLWRVLTYVCRHCNIKCF